MRQYRPQRGDQDLNSDQKRVRPDPRKSLRQEYAHGEHHKICEQECQSLAVDHLHDPVIGDQKGLIYSSAHDVDHEKEEYDHIISSAVEGIAGIVRVIQIPHGAKGRRHQDSIEDLYRPQHNIMK